MKLCVGTGAHPTAREHEPKLQRMLQYWAATGLLYAVCGVLVVLQVHVGVTEPAAGACLIAYGIGGVAFFLRAGAAQ